MGIVFDCHKTKCLEDASLPFTHRMQHLSHALDVAGLGLKRNFHEIAFGEASRELQQSAVHGDDVNVAFRLLAVAEFHQHGCGCEFYAISTMSWVGLGKVCHANATIALAEKHGEITEAHCPDSQVFRVLACDFHPFFCCFCPGSPEGFRQGAYQIGRNQ